MVTSNGSVLRNFPTNRNRTQSHLDFCNTSTEGAQGSFFNNWETFILKEVRWLKLEIIQFRTSSSIYLQWFKDKDLRVGGNEWWRKNFLVTKVPILYQSNESFGVPEISKDNKWEECSKMLERESSFKGVKQRANVSSRGQSFPIWDKLWEVIWKQFVIWRSSTFGELERIFRTAASSIFSWANLILFEKIPMWAFFTNSFTTFVFQVLQTHGTSESSLNWINSNCLNFLIDLEWMVRLLEGQLKEIFFEFERILVNVIWEPSMYKSSTIPLIFTIFNFGPWILISLAFSKLRWSSSRCGKQIECSPVALIRRYFNWVKFCKEISSRYEEVKQRASKLVNWYSHSNFGAKLWMKSFLSPTRFG